MAAVTICSDFGAPPKIKSDTVSTVSPSGTIDRFKTGKGLGLGLVMYQGKVMYQGCIISPAYLTSTQSTSHKLPEWMNHKLSRKNINNFTYADDTTVMAKSEDEPKQPLDEGETG